MKIKLRSFWDACAPNDRNSASFQKLMRFNFPSKIGCDISRFFRKNIKEEFEIIDEERIKIAKKHTDEGEANVNPENYMKFSKEFDDLLNSEREFNFEKLVINLKPDQNIGLAPDDFFNLEDFITFKFEEKIDNKEQNK